MATFEEIAEKISQQNANAQARAEAKSNERQITLRALCDEFNDYSSKKDLNAFAEMFGNEIVINGVKSNSLTISFNAEDMLQSVAKGPRIKTPTELHNAKCENLTLDETRAIIIAWYNSTQ